MEYKGYSFSIGDDDQIHCGELDLTTSTAKEMKAAIDAFKKVELAAIKTKVLFLLGGWRENSFLTGVAGARHGEHYRWVTYKVDGRSRRETKRASDLYLDTPKNQKSLKEYGHTLKEARDLENKAQKILERLDTLASKDVKA